MGDNNKVDGIDLLHPLVVSSIKWADHCTELPVSMKDCQVVSFKGKVYVGGGTAATDSNDPARLYVYSPKDNTWDSMNTPVSHFALAIYKSKIVLVGGRVCYGENKQITNKVWVMPDKGFGRWKHEIIPNMKLQRFGASAVSIDDILIVTGGENETSALGIEIYDGKKWWNVNRPSDLCGSDVKIVLHEGDCYLFGGRHGRSVFSAKLASLIATCKMGDELHVSWRQMPNIPKQVAGGYPTVFGNTVVIQNGGVLYAYSPHTCDWVYVQNIPNGNLFCTGVTSSSRELMIIGGVSAETKVASSKVVKASIDDPVYDPNKKFTLEELSLIQSAAGVPLLLKLERKQSHFLRIIRVKQKTPIKDALEQWITDGVPSHIEPTWKNLMMVLCFIELDELANQVDRVLKNSAEVSTQCYVEIYQKEVHGVKNDTQPDQHASCVSSPDHRMEYQYCARLYFIHHNRKIASYEIHFVIIRNVGKHLSVINEEYEGKGAHSGPYQPIHFEENVISLETTCREPEAKGWKLTPLSPPHVTKQQVDQFEHGKVPPGCQLLAHFSSQKKNNIPDVSYQINLRGAKSPYNYFVITLPLTDHKIASPLKRRHSMSEIEQGSAKKSCLDESVPECEAEPVPKLKDLFKELCIKANIWENIGIMLSINEGKLALIKSNNPNDSTSCLREMLREWLKSVDPKPSWSAMIIALEDLKNDPALVQELKSKYC